MLYYYDAIMKCGLWSLCRLSVLGDQLAKHDVFPLRGIDLFKLSTHCTCPSTLHMSLHTQARSQVGKRGGSKIINVDLKWAWITKRGWVREGMCPLPREAWKLLKTLILQLNANQFADTCTSTLIPLYNSSL